MGMELVGPSKRTLAGILCWFFETRQVVVGYGRIDFWIFQVDFILVDFIQVDFIQANFICVNKIYVAKSCLTKYLGFSQVDFIHDKLCLDKYINNGIGLILLKFHFEADYCWQLDQPILSKIIGAYFKHYIRYQP